MERQFVTENRKERERLKKLVNSLTDEELKLVIYKEGWTIAVALAHLAFWDQRALTLLRRWKKSGVAPSPSDTDVTNNALLPLFLAIPPRIASNMALSSADAADREAEGVSPKLRKVIEGLNEPYRLNRSIHRKMHLDEIEAFLKARRGVK